MTPREAATSREDQALDRRLQEALAVEPSPAFRARVRARLAEEPEPAARHWLVWPAAGVAAAVLSMAAVLWPVERAGVARLPSMAPAAAARMASFPDAARARLPALIARRDQRPAAAVERLPSNPGTVQFDPAEREAFAWLVSLSRRPVGPLDAELPSDDGAAVVAPIEVPSITVEPIAAAEGEPEP
jgi:hypothetical protein